MNMPSYNKPILIKKRVKEPTNTIISCGGGGPKPSGNWSTPRGCS